MRRALPVLLALMASVPLPAADCSADPESVAARARSLIAADNAGDVERVLGHYTDDVEWITPGGELIRGKDAIRLRYESLFADYRAQMVAEVDAVDVGEHFAAIRGRTRGTLTPHAPAGTPQPVDDVFLAVLECQDDGVWRVDRLMWTPSAADPADG